MKNIFRSKLVSATLAATIMLGTITAPVRTNCSFVDNIQKGSSTVGRFFTSKFGAKAIAAGLLIAQNITQFCADQSIKKDPKNDLKKDSDKTKSENKKGLDFYLGAAAGVFSAGADGKTLDIANAGVNLFFGVNPLDKLYDFADNILIKTYKKCEEKMPILKTISDKIKLVKSSLFDGSSLFQSFLTKIQSLNSSQIWKFLTSKYGVKTLSQLMLLANGSLSFYNEENGINSGITKLLPFYLSTTSSLASKLAGKKFYDFTKSFAKLCLGEKLSKQVKQKITLKLPTYAGQVVSEKLAGIIF